MNKSGNSRYNLNDSNSYIQIRYNNEARKMAENIKKAILKIAYKAYKNKVRKEQNDPSSFEYFSQMYKINHKFVVFSKAFKYCKEKKYKRKQSRNISLQIKSQSQVMKKKSIQEISFQQPSQKMGFISKLLTDLSHPTAKTNSLRVLPIKDINNCTNSASLFSSKSGKKIILKKRDISRSSFSSSNDFSQSSPRQFSKFQIYSKKKVSKFCTKMNNL
mmetsp:Transcript_5469/g.4651  ORF Transcript_5469/g.4651 Transcript_5469/m.4651 type:complete len:217 (+) Transcript_5469:416-1066(+)